MSRAPTYVPCAASIVTFPESQSAGGRPCSSFDFDYPKNWSLLPGAGAATAYREGRPLLDSKPLRGHPQQGQLGWGIEDESGMSLFL